MRAIIRSSVVGEAMEAPFRWALPPKPKRVPTHRPCCFIFSPPGSPSSELRSHATSTSSASVRSPDITLHSATHHRVSHLELIETGLEKIVYSFRFVSFLGVLGSLVGSFVCFIKGCSCVVSSFATYAVNPGRVVIQLVEAIDVYLLGTVMLVFGMGLYELFVSNLDIAKMLSTGKGQRTSNLFGMFTLKEKPRWLKIKSVDELKTQVGHVIVMLLLIGLFEKSKKAAINTPFDLLCFSASVLLSSGCLYLLSKLTEL